MKINVGSSKLKSSYFPIPLDSSTSSNFGECIPTFCHEVVADSHVNIDMRQGVRFAPLSLPTFGKAYLHSYAYYHKFSDLWAPYNDFLAQTPYTNSSGSSYIPLKAPSVPLSLFWMICCCHCTWSVWKLQSSVVTSPSGSPLQVGSYQMSPLTVGSSDGFSLNRGFVRTLASICGLGTSFLDTVQRTNNFIYGMSQDVPSQFISSSEENCVTPAGSDFMFRVPAGSLYQRPKGEFAFSAYNFTPSTDVVVCLKLNNSGKLLRKIFLGLGYQLKLASNHVSFLPVFAFYKSYFQTFAPKRFVKYEQTFFGRLMTHIVNTGESLLDVFSRHATDDPGYLPGIIDDLLTCFYTEDTDYYSSQIIGLVNDYAGDLMQPYIAVNSDGSVSYDQIYADVSKNAPPSVNFYETPVGLGPINHTQSQQNVLSRLTNFVNRRSILGGKIADLLESVFGIPTKDVLKDDNPYVGSSIIDVDFSDVFSTAETAEGSLGEYAGKAVGAGSADKLDVKCSSPGLVLVFQTVIPRTQKVQGVNPNLFHIVPSDYYNPSFDGITLLPTNKLSLFCVDSLMEPVSKYISSFGNQSVFSEYKNRTQGILNGDLSLLSTKSTYDSFTMDQVLANYVSQENVDSSTIPGTIVATVTAPKTENLTAGTMWRFIGRWLWLGNFDRIFVNTRQFFDLFGAQDFTWNTRDIHTTDDNLVIHNVVDLKINAPMLPNSDSYMTKDLDELSNDVGVRSQGE